MHLVRFLAFSSLPVLVSRADTSFSSFAWEQDLLNSPEGPPPVAHGEEPNPDMFGGGGEWLTWNQLMPEEDVVASCWTQLIDVEQDDGRVIFFSHRYRRMLHPALRPRSLTFLHYIVTLGWAVSNNLDGTGSRIL